VGALGVQATTFQDQGHPRSAVITVACAPKSISPRLAWCGLAAHA
jgi:hypothetical protein